MMDHGSSVMNRSCTLNTRDTNIFQENDAPETKPYRKV